MATTLFAQFSDAVAATVETISQSLVRIEARPRVPATGLVWSPDGVLITAHHIIEEDDNIQVGLPDGRTLPATLVGRDPTTDLAVLRLVAADLVPPPWATTDELRVGQVVLALGRPGRHTQAALGIICRLGDSWRTAGGSLIERYIQADLEMYPGFSGGPLVNAAGQVIGLNTSALLRGAPLTLPVATLHRVAEMLLAHGRVRRGYLGVSTQPVRLPAALSQRLGQETGLLLLTVEPHSPAEQAGLLLGDTIVALDTTAVRQTDDLLAYLSTDRLHTTVQVHVVRGGQPQELSVLIAERR